MFDNYGRRPPLTETVVSQLTVGKLVRFDVVVDTRWGTGVDDTGVLAVTTLEGRSADADSITVYELVETLPCGGWGYLDADLFRDCVVDVKDLAIFAQDWLVCNDPEVAGCIENRMQ